MKFVEMRWLRNFSWEYLNLLDDFNFCIDFVKLQKIVYGYLLEQ